MYFCQFLLESVCNETKGRISKKQWIQENKAQKIFRKLTGAKNVTFQEILCALFSCNHHFFEIHPFALLPTNKSRRFQNNTWFSLLVLLEKYITNEPHISTVFLSFVYLSTFLIA